LLFARTPGKQFAHSPRELLNVLGTELLTSFGGALARQLSGLGVREALLFRPREGRVLYQYTLALVPFPRTAKPDYDRA
jgi:hypothetical protein